MRCIHWTTSLSAADRDHSTPRGPRSSYLHLLCLQKPFQLSDFKLPEQAIDAPEDQRLGLGSDHEGAEVAVGVVDLVAAERIGIGSGNVAEQTIAVAEGDGVREG